MMLLKKLYEPGNIVVISQVNLIPSRKCKKYMRLLFTESRDADSDTGSKILTHSETIVQYETNN